MNAIKTILTGISATLKHRSIFAESKSPEDKVVFMTFQEARKDPALMKEMTEQSNEASIITGTQAEYVSAVTFRNRQYYISGPHSEWMAFYGMINSKGQRA